jgi:hypothetical protein
MHLRERRPGQGHTRSKLIRSRSNSRGEKQEVGGGRYFDYEKIGCFDTFKQSPCGSPGIGVGSIACW